MNKIDELIQKGKTFNFNNNSYNSTNGIFFTKASDELLAWIATVEDFIISNYGEQSSAYKLYQTFNRRQLDGYYQDSFDKQMSILMGSLKACKNISPKTLQIQKEEHLVIQLIKNAYFWTVIVIAVGSAFGLGQHFGTSKFDKEKSEYYELTRKQEIVIKEYKNSILLKDSTIDILKKKIRKLEENPIQNTLK